VAWEFLVEHWQIVFVLALIALMLTAFVTELLPIEITALSVLAILGLSGLLSIEEALSGFSSHATVTVLMMFILSAAVVQSGMVDWVGDRMGVLMGRSMFRHVFVIGLIAGPVSAFINNTAAVAVMIPLVMHLADKTGQSPSKLLIPLSYTAMLGGVTTVIGTSTNLLGSTLHAEAGLGHFGIFEFAQAGIIIFGIGLVYLAFVGSRLVPDRVEPKSPDKAYFRRAFLFEATVPEKSQLINKRVVPEALGRYLHARVILVRRGPKTFDPMEEPVYYHKGDRIVAQATRATLQRLTDHGILDINALSGRKLGKKEREFRELLVTSGASARGKRLGSLEFWSHYHVQPVALLTRRRRKNDDLDDHRLRTGDVVLAAVPKEQSHQMTGRGVFEVLGGPAPPLRRPHKVPLVVLILAGVVGFAALDIFPIVFTATAGAILMVVTGALRLSDMYASIRWDVIFLLAGVIPLGIAMHTTGTAALLGGAIAGASHMLPPLLLLALFFLSVSILTEIVSNNASVVLMIPIGLEIAAALGYNPTTFVLAAMFAASTSFLSPIGYQTNLMVMAPGGYRYLDYLKIGGPLNLIMVIVTPLVLNLFWPVVSP
jgi:di/tricarboxylate transporter